jgi:hypothetical protein
LHATGHFDNSWLNPNNPDPDATVHWGQQMKDEMFNTLFIVRHVPIELEAETQPLEQAAQDVLRK